MTNTNARINFCAHCGDTAGNASDPDNWTCFSCFYTMKAPEAPPEGSVDEYPGPTGV